MTNAKRNALKSPNQKISLAQAMEAAVAKTGGKVAEANFRPRKDKAIYVIETVVNGQESVVGVEAYSGNVVELPKREKGEHPPKHGHHGKGERPEHDKKSD